MEPYLAPYIGVTGFTRPKEIETALREFPADSKRSLMIGILATWKSLRGIPMKPRWARQTPAPKAISKLLPCDGRVVNLVHYSTEEGYESSMLADMIRIHELAGPNLNGFQINIAWPEIRLVDEYRMAFGFGANHRLVLQIGEKAIEQVGGTVQKVVDMLEHYVGSIYDVLIDPSGGHGQPLNVERAREFLSAIRDRGWNLGLGVAGGLGPDSLHLIEPLIAEFPHLSIDAQGRLRDAENNLDLNAVHLYLERAVQLFV